MDGVFINLSDTDITLKDSSKNKEFIIKCNYDLLTPTRNTVNTKNMLSGIISTQLSDDDIHTIQSKQLFNTVYNKITRSEQNMTIDIIYSSPYIKYSFTKDQIEKINSISNGRTRLLILSQEDVEYWSSGNFQSPFNNYRLFTNTYAGLIEYPVPKSYKDIVSDSLGTIVKKLTMW
jgi:hypothetical protein